MGILTIITFFPLLGAIHLLFRSGRDEEKIRRVALYFTIVPLVLSLVVLARYNPALHSFQMEELIPWIPSMNVSYHLGLDGISIPLLVLTTLLSTLCILASWGISKRVKEYFIFFLVLESGMIGVFMALDLFLFYVFWEIMLVPMYFLIGIWGGPRREYAAIKFFLYTLAGSVLMLLSIIALYFRAGTLDIALLIEFVQKTPFAGNFALFVFLGFFVGFAVKVPCFPFHTWLPDAHVQAPTAISVILAGVLLKMGGYGFLRISYPILPFAAHYFATPIAILALISIVYGAFVAMAQNDLKMMVAYSSVSHMGFVMLGIAAMNEKGFSGAAMQMFTHGIITGALFLLVGVIYDRCHTRDINSFGGLMTKIPIFAGILSVSAFASLGLPGLAGFVSEFIVFMGGFEVFPYCTAIATIGIVITAAYFLNMMQKMLLGTFNAKWEHDLIEINHRELASVVPLVVIMFAVGVCPSPLINLMNESLKHILVLVK
ncbi:MAG: NADH-quinone oxidoreductase subunit M [Candidatus Riflebacteria bacterium]|nr:NADH-quinone oxidoreductase subunit M [Candidatus Riflebacteria bacterium]